MKKNGSGTSNWVIIPAALGVVVVAVLLAAILYVLAVGKGHPVYIVHVPITLGLYRGYRRHMRRRRGC